jgi:NAD+ kinase
MKKIVLLPNPNKDEELLLTQEVTGELISLGATVYIEKGLLSVNGACYYERFPADAELIIVIGGDGSMLDASVTAIEYDIPIVGVNLGKLGYLSEIEPENLALLSRIISGDYKINEMMLLSATVVSSDGEISSQRLAVNDVIISHDKFLGIAEFNLENSRGEELKYRADGMILSTPQGSTAYSLSAGGPIVSHFIDCIVATPICPHSFFNRSIVFSPFETVTLKNQGDGELNVSIDGRFFKNVSENQSCLIRKAEKRLKLLSFKDNNMLSTLFSKMRKLEDIK